jgi:hypothetical protein
MTFCGFPRLGERDAGRELPESLYSSELESVIFELSSRNKKELYFSNFYQNYR